LAAEFPIAHQHLARPLTQDVAFHSHTAFFQFADPVGRQWAFVEFGEFDEFGRCVDSFTVSANQLSH